MPLVPSLHQHNSIVNYNQTKYEQGFTQGDENKQASMQNKLKYVVSQTFETCVKHISIAAINPNKWTNNTWHYPSLIHGITNLIEQTLKSREVHERSLA